MAARFLHKLLGSSAPPGPAVTAALAELDRLANERSELAGPIALVRDFLSTLYQEPVLDPLPSLPDEVAAAKLRDGVPLLHGEPVLLDAKGFHRRWRIVCAAVQKYQQANAGKVLSEAVRNGKLDLNLLTSDLLSGRVQAIHARARGLGLDPGLAATVLRLTLFAVLERFSAAVAHFREKVPWGRGYCPTCGSWPLLGEFRGLEQTRFLRCGLCTSEWEFPRLLCPFCGTRDHHLLGYFHVEGEEARCRAATCDACRGYVKMVSTLAALSGPQLLITELAVLHLDLAALRRNYSAPA
jgi:FdhE protein